MKTIVLKILTFYQKGISPVLHAVFGAQNACRFYPTCSEYMYEAVSRHGILTGLKLGIVRIGKCNPYHEGGTDPVPIKK